MSAKAMILIVGIVPLICGCTVLGTFAGAIIDSELARPRTIGPDRADRIPHGRMICVTCRNDTITAGRNSGLIALSDTTSPQDKWRTTPIPKALVLETSGARTVIPLQDVQYILVSPSRHMYWLVGLGVGAGIDAVIIAAIAEQAKHSSFSLLGPGPF